MCFCAYLSLSVPMTLPVAAASDPSKKKHRCWQFHLCGISNGETTVAHARSLESFRSIYTAAKRLTINPVPCCRVETKPSPSHVPDNTKGGCVVVEVQFSGPQSAERPAVLLNRLFQAERVAVYPVALRRGRKRSLGVIKEVPGDKTNSCASTEVHGNSGDPIEASPAIDTTSGTNTSSDTMNYWRHAKRRSASGENLPSPASPRMEEEEEEEEEEDAEGGDIISDSVGNDNDDDNDDDIDYFWSFEEEDLTAVGASCSNGIIGRSLLCGAWSRCVDPLSWVDEEDEDVAAGHGREGLAGPRRDGDDGDGGGGGGGGGGGNESTAKATGRSGYWTDIDLGGDGNSAARGEGDGGENGRSGLSPLTVTTSPFLRIDPSDADFLKCAAVSALTGGLRVSPLTVQAPGRSAPCPRRRPVFFGDGERALANSDGGGVGKGGGDRPRGRSGRSLFDEGERTLAGSEGGSDGLRGRSSSSSSSSGSGGGAPVAPRAPWEGCGVACLPAGDEAGDAAAGGEGSPTGGEGSPTGGEGSPTGGEGSPTGGEGSPTSPGRLGRGTGAAAGGGGGETRRGQSKQQKGDRSRKRSGRAVEMVVEPLHEECDFDGRPAQLEKPMDSPFAAAFSAPPDEDEHHLVFLGLLGGTGQPLGMLTARAQFSVSGGRRAEREVGPLQAATNGRVYGTVQYPSMKELWPDIYTTPGVRAVEVNLCVEVRPLHRKVRYLQVDFKVMYRRGGVGTSQGALWRP